MFSFIIIDLAVNALVLTTSFLCRNDFYDCELKFHNQINANSNFTETDEFQGCLKCQENRQPDLNIDDLTNLFETIPLLALAVYAMPFVFMFPLFCGIRVQFKAAFMDVYLDLRCRLILYFVFGQTIILIRSFFYFRINYHYIDPDPDGSTITWVRIYQYLVYASEIINGAAIMYISYKNLQGNDEDDQEAKDLERMNDDERMRELLARSRGEDGAKSSRRKPTLLGNRFSAYRKLSLDQRRRQSLAREKLMNQHHAAVKLDQGYSPDHYSNWSISDTNSLHTGPLMAPQQFAGGTLDEEQKLQRENYEAILRKANDSADLNRMIRARSHNQATSSEGQSSSYIHEPFIKNDKSFADSKPAHGNFEDDVVVISERPTEENRRSTTLIPQRDPAKILN